MTFKPDWATTAGVVGQTAVVGNLKVAKLFDTTSGLKVGTSVNYRVGF